MPFHMKIQPIDDSDVSEEVPFPETMRQMPKSRLKRLFERQFTNKNVSEKFSGSDVEAPLSRGNSGDFEPSSVCLAKMVLNFMEDNNNGEKQRCGRSRCNCFSGSGKESSDDESEWSDGFKCSSGEACEILKSLVLCTSIRERNLLADVTKIVETSKNCKLKDESCLESVVNGLVSLGYDAALCKSRWEKSPSCPAGEYEYVDVIMKGERLLIDIDFKSKFEIARATKTYKSMLQTLPYIFVGKVDRLQRIIILICKAAKQSLKKKGLHVPPWRRAEYVKSKWLSSHVRVDQNSNEEVKQESVDMITESVGSIVFGV
ncbi:PDDEXK-like [Arabidopsis suecica]|uniref:PDDEXK-like n=1 Tax=Arabidopsis suecica TaxID=45249 RepID=A0A8T2AIJ0_ARASU|nr:PDDEXK-like [Arabidopsis suecica]